MAKDPIHVKPGRKGLYEEKARAAGMTTKDYSKRNQKKK